MKKLIEKIKNIPKSYFSLNDMRKISDMDEGSLKVTVNRLVKKGELIRISRGYYANSESEIAWENFSEELYGPSYLSFEWALAIHNVLSQKPMNLTLATAKRSRKVEMIDNIIFYRHIKPDLFWGFSKTEDGYLLADPEKAYLDLAYLSLNGYAHFDSEEMNLKLLDRKKIKEYLRKFKNKRLNKLIAEVI
jgi:predicted transcriptional regulator of viral defense system